MAVRVVPGTGGRSPTNTGAGMRLWPARRRLDPVPAEAASRAVPVLAEEPVVEEVPVRRVVASSSMAAMRAAGW